jgi:hypothetical protein
MAQLEHVQAQVRPQVLLGGRTFGGVGIEGNGGAGAMGKVPSVLNIGLSLTPNFVDDVKDVGVRVVKLESMKDGYDITIGI